MAALVHGEYALGGYRFGTGHPVYPSEQHRPGIEWRDQDTVSPTSDRILFGRDYRTPKPIQFELTITGDTPAETAENVARLAAAWEYHRTQWEPGAETTLAFNKHGRILRYYGRPRTLDLPDSDSWMLETVKGKAEFLPSEPVAYEDAARSLTLTLTPGEAGGLIFPITFPWGTTNPGQRQGIINDAGGIIPTRHVTVAIKGPVTNPTVKGPGWAITLNTTLAYDETVTLDARRSTALRQDGASMAGVIGRRFRFDTLQIPPGASEITFTGTDQSGTSSATVTWHPATA